MVNDQLTQVADWCRESNKVPRIFGYLVLLLTEKSSRGVKILRFNKYIFEGKFNMRDESVKLTQIVIRTKSGREIAKAITKHLRTYIKVPVPDLDNSYGMFENLSAEKPLQV